MALLDRRKLGFHPLRDVVRNSSTSNIPDPDPTPVDMRAQFEISLVKLEETTSLIDSLSRVLRNVKIVHDENILAERKLIVIGQSPDGEDWCDLSPELAKTIWRTLKRYVSIMIFSPPGPGGLPICSFDATDFVALLPF